jgi:hypothetical protein
MITGTRAGFAPADLARSRESVKERRPVRVHARLAANMGLVGFDDAAASQFRLTDLPMCTSNPEVIPRIF